MLFRSNASKQNASAVKRAAQELLKHEIYTLAYVGFSTNNMSEAELRKQASRIGFPEVLVAGLSQEALRRIFHLVSVSTVRVSQNQGSTMAVFA